MSKAHFTIAYDGPALREGRMEVSELAHALLAVGQVFSAANKVLNGETAKVSVHVVATRNGSFEINLEVIQSLVTQITGLLTGEQVTAAANLVGLITGVGVPSGVSLLWLIKRLRGRQPERIERRPDTTEAIMFEGDTIIAPVNVVRLYQDIHTRRVVRLMVAPLTQDGISEFAIREDGKTILPITVNDIHSFDDPVVLEEEVLIEHVIKHAFTIVSLAFRERNKWRLNDGNATISVLIEDEDFLRRIDENLIAFAKGDILICEMRVRQVHGKDDAIRNDYAVQRVIEHKPAARQLGFSFDGNPNPEHQ